MKHIAITGLVTCLLLGCGKPHGHNHNGHGHEHDGHEHDDKGHKHEAIYGGELVEFGEDACYLEFLMDESNATRMTVLAYEFHPPGSVKIPMTQIEVVAKIGDEEKQLVFLPVIDATLGNNATHSSKYEVAADWLKDMATFEGRIVQLDFPGGISHNKTFQFTKNK